MELDDFVVELESRQDNVRTDVWYCSLCTYENKMGRARCEMCDNRYRKPSLEVKVYSEETKTTIRRMANDNNWEACYQSNLIQKLGKDMMVRILDYCDPGDIVSVGMVNRWCQTVSLRPELWKDLFKRDYLHFLDNVSDARRYEASNLLAGVISTNKNACKPGWEKNGKDVYLSIVWGLKERVEAREHEVRQARLEGQQMKHEDRMESYVDLSWPVLSVGFVLFILTLCLLIVKLIYPDSLTWTDAIAPLASAFVLHSLYLIAGGVYSFVATCLHPRAFLNLDWFGPGFFSLGWISIPWGAFFVLLILEIEGAIHWTYSYIFISLYLAIFCGLAFWSVWVYRLEDSCETYVIIPWLAFSLVLGFFIPMGLKLDDLYSGDWVVVWVPIWIMLSIVVIIFFVLTYIFIADHEYSKLLLWLPVLAVLAQFILIPLKLDSPEMCSWLYVLMPLILLMFGAVCGCCVLVAVLIYEN